MTDPYLYECEVTFNENSRFPDVEFHRITDSDAVQHQMIIIRELQAQNKELEVKNKELLKQIAELQQTCKEMSVKMHSAINAYEILKQKTGYKDDNNKKKTTEEIKKESEEKTEQYKKNWRTYLL